MEPHPTRPRLCLSRLSIVGLLGPDTPIPVVEEIALAHNIQVESNRLKNNKYFLQMIQKIHRTRIQNVSEPFNYRDYVSISKFINPYTNPRVWPELRPNNLPIYTCSNDTIGTLRSSLSRYFGFRSWSGFESLDVNFQLGLITPTSPNNVDVCILFRYCSLRGLTTNRSTTIREMEALVRMDLQGDLFFLQQQIISTISSQNLSRRSLINALHSLVGSSIPYLSGEYISRNKPGTYFGSSSHGGLVLNEKTERQYNTKSFPDSRNNIQPISQTIEKRSSGKIISTLMNPDNLILVSSNNIEPISFKPLFPRELKPGYHPTSIKTDRKLPRQREILSSKIIPKNKRHFTRRQKPKTRYLAEKNHSQRNYPLGTPQSTKNVSHGNSHRNVYPREMKNRVTQTQQRRNIINRTPQLLNQIPSGQTVNQRSSLISKSSLVGIPQEDKNTKPMRVEKEVQNRKILICPPSLARTKNTEHVKKEPLSPKARSKNSEEHNKNIPIIPLFNFDKAISEDAEDSREERLIKIHKIIDSIANKRIIPGTVSEINTFVRQKLKQLKPNSQINAIILAAVLYQIDISYCFDPQSELKSIFEYGGNIEKYQALDTNLKKRMNSDRLKLDGPILNLVFNPVLPRPLYNPRSLDSMALGYGDSEDEILVDDPYYLLQMSVLTDHFYQGKSKNTLNRETPIELDQVGDLRLWEYVSYGHPEKGYSVIKYSELNQMFRMYGYFRCLKNNPTDSGVYPRQSIKRLFLLSLRPSYQDEPEESINLRHGLALKIHQIIQDDETLMPAERNLRNKYRENDTNRRIIKQLMDKFLDITMKMRGWTGTDKHGRPTPYPIIRTPVDNPYQIEVRVTGAIGDFDRFCGEHEECSKVFLKYPLFKYRGGYVRSNDIDDGFTIQDRLNIVRLDQIITACIRLTSNWFGATHSKISKVLGMDQAFDIKQLRNIG